MSAAEHLGSYAEGWTKGDAEQILSATADGFVFDDPNAGRISRSDFAQYLSAMKATVDSQRGEDSSATFMQLSEVVTGEDAGVLTAWCWWAVPGTSLQGSGLIKVSDEGVRSEVITYYARPAA